MRGERRKRAEEVNGTEGEGVDEVKIIDVSAYRPRRIPIVSSRDKGIFSDCFEVKNGLLSIFTFPDRLLGKAISYHFLSVSSQDLLIKKYKMAREEESCNLTN